MCWKGEESVVDFYDHARLAIVEVRQRIERIGQRVKPTRVAPLGNVPKLARQE